MPPSLALIAFGCIANPVDKLDSDHGNGDGDVDGSGWTGTAWGSYLLVGLQACERQGHRPYSQYKALPREFTFDQANAAHHSIERQTALWFLRLGSSVDLSFFRLHTEISKQVFFFCGSTIVSFVQPMIRRKAS